MPEVPEHLVPTDGLTDSRIHFAGMDTHHNDSGATMRFDIFDDRGDFVGTFNIDVYATEKGTVDAMIANAYRKLTDMLRQWLYCADQTRQAYDNKGAK